MEIRLKNVSVSYMKGTPSEKKALENVSLTIPKGKITGIIGHTGSGKSTLAQVIAGLVPFQSGEIQLEELIFDYKSKYPTNIRRKVGLVFQFPEHQLFAENVKKDIQFALENFGFSQEIMASYVTDAMEAVNLSEEFADKSPYHLSGGQMRKAAIAGIIVYKPMLLILDEPTVGLDPATRAKILDLIHHLNKEYKLTVIIVSHNMDDIGYLTDKVVVLNEGKVYLDDSTEEVFKQYNQLARIGMDIPEITKLINKINQLFDKPIPLSCYSLDELEYHLASRLKELPV